MDLPIIGHIGNGEEGQPLTKEQYVALVSAARNATDRTALLIGLNSGISIDELLAIRWDDLDFQAGSVFIKDKQLSRVVYLPSKIMKMLKEYRAAHGQDHIYLFGFSKSTLIRNVQYYGKSLNLGNLSWSTIRHTYALHGAKFLPPEVLSKNIGVSVNAVMKYYPLNPDTLRNTRMIGYD